MVTVADALPAEPAGVEADQDDERGRGIGRPPCKPAETGPARGHVPDVERRDHAGRDHRERQAEAPAAGRVSPRRCPRRSRQRAPRASARIPALIGQPARSNLWR